MLSLREVYELGNDLLSLSSECLYNLQGSQYRATPSKNARYSAFKTQLLHHNKLDSPVGTPPWLNLG